jgi:hypothetical protein
MLLLMTAVTDRVATAACNFEVSVDGGPFTPASTLIPGPAQFVVPDGANVIDVRATSHSPEFWPTQGRYHVTGAGSLTPTDTPDNFAPPLGAEVGGFGGVSLTAYLTRLRDATADALATLGAVPAQRTTSVPSPWPPVAWDTPQALGIDVVDEIPISGADLSATNQALDPQTTDLVFERRGDTVPRLFAVSWPDSVPIWPGAGATPLLVYFHANMGHNVENGYYFGPYPYHFDYIFYGLWNYLNCRDSPLTKWPYSLGLPYQVAASGKPVVLVLPCSSAQQEVGNFRHADGMAIILREIQSAMFRRSGVYEPPDLGRLALAGFSASTGLVAAFLNDASNRAHPLLQQNLREVYGFDPPDTEVFGFVGAVTSWMTSLGGPDAMARLYRQTESPVLSQFLAPATIPQVRPFVASTPDEKMTLGLVPAQTWRAAAAARGAPGMGFQYTEVHHMFPSLFLTDALRRSGF